MNKVKMVVFVDGRLVTQVLSNESIEVVVVDNDSEGLDDDEASIVMGKETFVDISIKNAEVNSAVVQQVFKDVDR